MSIGGHYGWLAVGPDRRAHSKALAMSLWTPIVPHLEVRAEAFTGQALAGLGGGGIGQSFGRDSIPVRTSGGWVQLNVRPSEMWEVGAGAGLDDPNDDDLDPATARLRNLAFEGHAVWRLHPMVVGGEVRRLEPATVRSATSVATQVNLAVGSSSERRLGAFGGRFRKWGRRALRGVDSSVGSGTGSSYWAVSSSPAMRAWTRWDTICGHPRREAELPQVVLAGLPHRHDTLEQPRQPDRVLHVGGYDGLGGPRADHPRQLERLLMEPPAIALMLEHEIETEPLPAGQNAAWG